MDVIMSWMLTEDDLFVPSLQLDGIIYSAASSACQKSVWPGLAKLLDQTLNFGRGLSKHMGTRFKHIHRMVSGL